MYYFPESVNEKKKKRKFYKKAWDKTDPVKDNIRSKTH